MEGTSIQEMSAIQMNALTRQIVDVYHAYAMSTDDDSYARKHIHGLNPYFLFHKGFPTEDSLIKNFRSWLRGKDILALFANDPAKEKSVLNLNINDMSLPPWTERIRQPSHEVSLAFKNNFIPVLDKRCCKAAHNDFVAYPLFKNNDTEIAKSQHGFHCSLYDAYELYLTYIMN